MADAQQIPSDKKFLYTPNFERLKNSNASQIIDKYALKDFNELYEWSVGKDSGRDFYVEIINRLGLKFRNNYTANRDNIVNNDNPKYPHWFAESKLNIADSLLKASPDKIALKYQNELQDEITELTYSDLDKISNKIANALAEEGITKGDFIAISTPMNVEATCIYLAILKVGASVVCLADSYSVEDTDKRIAALNKSVKLIFTQDTSATKKKYDIYSKLLNCKNLPSRVIVISADSDNPAELKRSSDKRFEDFISGMSEEFNSVEMEPDDNLVILFSSGTTGDPKAIPWKADSFVKSAMDAHINFDMQPQKTLCWLTDYGWMMGSFALASSLINDGTMAIYEGNRGTSKACEFIEKSGINILGIVPAISEAWERSKIVESFNWDNVECICSTGNPSNPNNYRYLSSLINFNPTLEYMGGTEISGGYIIGCKHKALNPSMFNSFTCGTKVKIFEKNEGGFIAGEMAIIIPSKENGVPPIGISRELVNKAFNHEEKYYADSYTLENGDIARKHGDLLSIDENGMIRSEGRCDGALNINGIKTTIAELENAITNCLHNLPMLSNFAVIGARPEEGGEDKMIIFVQMKDGQNFSKPKLKLGLTDAIKSLNPQLAKISDIIEHDIPLTASGKKQHKILLNFYLETQK